MTQCEMKVRNSLISVKELYSPAPPDISTIPAASSTIVAAAAPHSEGANREAKMSRALSGWRNRTEKERVYRASDRP